MTNREAFEIWFREEARRLDGEPPDFSIDAATGDYLDWVAQMQLEVWLAAIEWKTGEPASTSSAKTPVIGRASDE